VSKMLAAMPIWVIMENAAALIGARRQFDREAS
jgi:glucokinase